MFFKDGSQIDQLAGTLQASGSAVVKEIEVQCYDGYELSCDVVGNFAVELKHDTDVSYTNAETTPYDVSAFAGSTETFQLRFTPTATLGDFAFRIRLGPTASPTEMAVYNDDEDEVLNDDNNVVYTEV